MLTHFDFDGSGQVLSRKCKSCNALLRRNQIICDMEQCQLAFSINYEGEKFEHFFTINVQFSDHTGTLLESRLSGAVAERVLALTPSQYQALSEQQKEEYKWKYLMNHFEVKLAVRKASAMRRQMSVLVVEMRAVEIPELAAKLCVFSMK